MTDIGAWVVGAMLAILGLVGLVVSSRAVDGTMYWVGLGLFVFCVLVIFGLIKESFDRRH